MLNIFFLLQKARFKFDIAVMHPQFIPILFKAFELIRQYSHRQVILYLVSTDLETEDMKRQTSVAWSSGLESTFYNDHNRPTLAALLRPWIRCFTIIISAWCSLTSSKLKKSEAKLNRKT